MLNAICGTPFVGYASLTNGAPGPTALTLYVNGAAFTATVTDRLYLTNITLSSNDGTQALITIDDNGSVPVKLASQYLSNVQPPGIVTIPPGTQRLAPGKVPRATASAVTAAKTVEVVVTGYVSKT